MERWQAKDVRGRALEAEGPSPIGSILLLAPPLAVLDCGTKDDSHRRVKSEGGRCPVWDIPVGALGCNRHIIVVVRPLG